MSESTTAPAGKSLAVVFRDCNTVSLDEIAAPPPRPGEVQIRTLVSVLSPGTENWVWQNRFTWQATAYPCVPGYQRCGTVVAIGEGVDGWNVGDLVAATTGNLGASIVSMWGAHAAIANSASGELYRVPEGLSPIDAAGFVVAQVGYNAASRVRLAGDDWIVVYGDGIIGQCAAQAARARGARVVLVGHRPLRLKLASELGVEHTVDGRKQEVAPAVRSAIGETHVTAVLDTVQGTGPQAEFIELLKPREGQIVYCGFSPTDAWADMAVLQKRELTTHFVSGWNRPRLEATIDLLAKGSLNLRGLVTHTARPEMAPEVYAMMRHKTMPFLGIALDWR